MSCLVTLFGGPHPPASQRTTLNPKPKTSAPGVPAHHAAVPRHAHQHGLRGVPGRRVSENKHSNGDRMMTLRQEGRRKQALEWRSEYECETHCRVKACTDVRTQ